MRPSLIRRAIRDRYARRDLESAILAGLRDGGKDLGALTVEDLASVDQFHSGGRGATLELARIARLHEGVRVLDAGGGLGGAARTLAQVHGCRVTVLDLMEDFCHIGARLTERLALSEQVRFCIGDALDMPFRAASFDFVWMQHASMNIENLTRLFSEVHRVLTPQGKLAIQEVVLGAVEPVLYPMPWARSEGSSFVHSSASLRTALKSADLREVTWIDITAALKQRVQESAAHGDLSRPLPPLGVHLLFQEDDFRRCRENYVRNMREERMGVIRTVYRRDLSREPHPC